jgi:uncharacterized membrane protein
MTSHFTHAASIALFLAAAGTACAGDGAAFTPVAGSSQVIDISDDGSRYISAGFSFSLWIDGVENPIGDQNTYSILAISGDGSTVIGTVKDDANLQYAGRWQEGTGWQNLGDLGLGGCDFNRSSGYNCNDDGSIVCGLSWEGCKGRAFVWTEDTGMFALPQTTNESARANAIANDGMTIAGWQQGNCRVAAYWTGWEGVEILPDDPNCGELYDMVDDGSIIVGDTKGQAVYWTEDTGLVGLGFLNDGFPTRAFGISNDASVIVGQSGSFPQGYTAFIWTEDLGMVDLRQLLIDNGAQGVPALTWANSVAVTDTEIIVTGASGNPPFTEGYVARISIAGGCYADFNGDGALNILDFVAFQNAFTAANDSADCNDDGALNILDFVCYQNAFTAGCN